ncbi:MAG: LysR substrate-binding domain-containing protein [Gammaproteobacteria bacterium]
MTAEEQNPLDRISLRSLRVFYVAARLMSFSAAARALCISQGAVSQRVKTVEEQLGTPLFERSNRRQIKLTDEGRHLCRALGGAFDAMGGGIRTVLSRGVKRRVVVGVLSSLAHKWLIPRLGGFYRQYPETELVIRAVNHTVSLDGDDVELGLVNLPEPPDAEDLRWQLLWREKLFAVCSPAYLKKTPLAAPADLASLTLLHDETEMANERRLDWQTFLSHFGVRRDDAARNLLFTQSDIALQAAIAGQGVALARNALAYNDIKNGLLVNPFGTVGAPVKTACYVCGRRDVWRLDKIAALRGWLASEAANDRKQR